MQFAAYHFKNPKLRFWAIIAAILFLGVIALGSAFQGPQSETWFSMPSLWFFGLVVLPLILYVLIRIYWAKSDRLS